MILPMSFISKLPFELFVGLRYTRAKRKNHFISFISLTSMVGIALGVAALIVVLSVMNGFQAATPSAMPTMLVSEINEIK